MTDSPCWLARSCSQLPRISILGWPVLTNVYVLEELQVHRFADDVFLANREMHASAMVALVQSFEDIPGIVRHHIIVRLDHARLVASRRGRHRLPWLVRREADRRPLRFRLGRQVGDVLLVGQPCCCHSGQREQERAQSGVKTHLAITCDGRQEPLELIEMRVERIRVSTYHCADRVVHIFSRHGKNLSDLCDLATEAAEIEGGGSDISPRSKGFNEQVQCGEVHMMWLFNASCSPLIGGNTFSPQTVCGGGCYCHEDC